MFRAPVLFLVLIIACVAAPDAPRTTDSDPEVARRWYSLPEDRDILPQGHRVWPPSDDGSRTIHYWFQDADAYNTLGATFELGIAKWAPAMRVSSLKFAPDSACPQKPYLCSEPHVAAEETLHVMLVDNQFPAQSSLGYRQPLIEKDYPDKPRNYMQWSRDTSLGKPHALAMAHELGEYLGGQSQNPKGTAPR